MHNVDQLIDKLIAIRDAYTGELPVVYAAGMPSDVVGDLMSCHIAGVGCYDSSDVSVSNLDVDPTHVFIL